MTALHLFSLLLALSQITAHASIELLKLGFNSDTFTHNFGDASAIDLKSSKKSLSGARRVEVKPNHFETP
jgi:hypothetical protein